MSDLSANVADFRQRLLTYKEAIDADIEAYTPHVKRITKEQFGAYPSVVTDAYLDLLSRGGKRIRGTLVMLGYEMCGGQDRQMIVRAATALEMTHTYILILDDIQDRSKRRRGKPTVHEMLAAYHREHNLRGDADHTGVALAINAACAGLHAAQVLLAGLSVSDELKVKALGIVNHTMITTAHGQTIDIMNELANDVADKDVDQVMEWKTAHYTILNPLCTGMVLAGAGCEDTDAIREYSLHTGMAFQITDDIMGVFGDDSQTGKSIMDDIREGKRTLLTQYALEHADVASRERLKDCLGKEDLSQEEFDACRTVLLESGALKHAQDRAKYHVEQALASLDRNAHRWQPEPTELLRGIAQSLLKRVA
ncbi:MAG TPA: polyprenyl synthetase family protein [Candidatus Saccharimonadales bacterium]|nr:polyprenyl synthetase family protein [Candidatus Saccharimonadales bacterium]